MLKFITWYFPIKFLLTIYFVYAHSIGTPLFVLTSIIDSFIIPIVVTIFFTFRKKKLKAGEYKIKSKGKHL